MQINNLAISQKTTGSYRLSFVLFFRQRFFQSGIYERNVISGIAQTKTYPTAMRSHKFYGN